MILAKIMGFTFLILSAMSLRQVARGIATGVLVVPSRYIGYPPYRIARIDNPKIFWAASLITFGVSVELIFVGYRFLAD